MCSFSSHQHNGTNPVFIRRVGLEMELLSPSIEHDAHGSCYWMGRRRTAPFQEYTTYEHHCAAEKLHIHVISALRGVGSAHTKSTVRSTV